MPTDFSWFRVLRKPASATALAVFAGSAWAQTAGYVGEQTRAAKSLSAREVADLHAGKGMGFAKPAELASFPGPMHVLEHARALALTPDQHRATLALIPPMRVAAIDAGERYIEAERALDLLFSQGSVDETQLHAALERSARALAGVRAAHLAAHIAQRELLSSEQIAQHDELRGYRERPLANIQKDY